MRYIAVINVAESGCYECDDGEICKGITDWAEVTDEQFELLVKASAKSFGYYSKLPRFRVLERPLPNNLNSFILKTIEDYTELIKAESEKARKEKEKREAAKLKREEAARLKKEASKAQKIEALEKELKALKS